MSRIFVYIINLFYVIPSAIVSFVFGHILDALLLTFLILWSLIWTRGPVVYLTDYRVHYNRSRHLLNFLFGIYLLLSYSQIYDFVTAVGSGYVSRWLIDNALDRYANESDMSLLARIKFVVMYLVTALTVLLSSDKLKIKNVVILFVVGTVELMALARAGLLLSLSWGVVLALFVGGYIIRLRSPLILYAKSILILILGVCFFLGTSLLRLSEGDDVYDVMSIKLQEYISGPVYLMSSAWRTDEMPILPNTYGANTFASVMKIFGTRLPAGVYKEVSTPWGDTVIRGSIYGIVQDFGLIFVYFFFLMYPIILKFLDQKKLPIELQFCQFVIIYIFIYPIISPLIYFNVLVGLIFSYLCIKYILYRTTL